MLERDIQKKSVKHARAEGWWACKFVGQGRRSVPDYMFGMGGRIFFVEFKRKGERATELQQECHEQMRSAGMTVYVCDSVDDFENVLAWETDRLQV